VFALWGPFATFDEQLQIYQGGRNFRHYGFLRTALLPDLSTSSLAEQHPLIYNHQPPGPQLLLGLLISVLSERYATIRVVLALSFVAGFLVYLWLLRSLEVGGGAATIFAFAFVSPRTVMHMIDHPAYSLFPLLAFLPPLALARFHATRKAAWLLTAVATAFAASNYLIYGPLFMMLMFWVLGAWLKVLPIDGRPTLLLAGIVVLGIVLHLLQTAVLVGSTMFLREITATVSNRVIGAPSHAELKDFYESIGFVLYAEHRLDGLRLIRAAIRSIQFPGWAPVLFVFLAAAGGRLFLVRNGPNGDDSVCPQRIAAAVLPAVLLPMFLFPAFAADYGLQGTNEFLLGLLAVGMLRYSWSMYDSIERSGLRAIAKLVFAIGLALTIATHALTVARIGHRLRVWAHDPALEAGLAWVSAHMAGETVMTNIDAIAIGFLTRQLAFGGCHEPAPPASPEPERCLLRSAKLKRTEAPTAAVYVWVELGNRFCSDKCIDRRELAKGYPALFTNDKVSVFDLSQPVVDNYFNNY
jgi:hypothetical protein